MSLLSGSSHAASGVTAVTAPGEATHQLIPLDAPTQWNAALEGVPHAFGHTWANCHAMQRTTGLPTYLYCFQQEGVRIVCPIVEREFEGRIDVLTPYGFSGFVGTGEWPGFAEQWREFARSRGYVCGYLAMHPLLGRESYAAADEICSSNSIYVLDLTKSAEELQAWMAKGRRHELRVWSRSGARLVDDRAALSAFFLRHHREFLAARGASRASFLSDETLAALTASENVLLLGAAQHGEIQAVILITFTSAVGEALFLISLPAGRRHSAPLFWQGALHLQALGVPAMSLGGGVREGDGIARAKQHFGARRVPIRVLKQVYDQETFRLLCRRAGADPAAANGYFPPYRADLSP